MRQRLGKKKTKKIERITGRPVASAWVRGNTEHFKAVVFYNDGQPANRVNYRTGQISEY